MSKLLKEIAGRERVSLVDMRAIDSSATREATALVTQELIPRYFSDQILAAATLWAEVVTNGYDEGGIPGVISEQRLRAAHTRPDKYPNVEPRMLQWICDKTGVTVQHFKASMGWRD